MFYGVCVHDRGETVSPRFASVNRTSALGRHKPRDALSMPPGRTRDKDGVMRTGDVWGRERKKGRKNMRVIREERARAGNKHNYKAALGS